MNIHRPNILLIVAQGLHHQVMGCAGDAEVVTPGIDRLAAEGTRFDHFFSVSPASSPARATLLTGQIPSQHGVHDWLDDATATGFLDGRPTYTQVLADGRFTCGLIGLWGLGDGTLAQHGFTWWNTEIVHAEDPIQAITDDALAYLDSHHDKAAPFYLAVQFPAPGSDQVACVPVADPDGQEAGFQAYGAAVTAMDDAIGRLLERLDALELTDGTIVWLLGDHGFNTSQHGIRGDGKVALPMDMREGSVRVPAIVRHPGVIPAGLVRTEMVSGYDFAHTLLEEVGLAMPNAKELPGRSVASLLDPDRQVDGDWLVVMCEYGPVRMIRTPAWKYILRSSSGPHELYDLAHDPEERTNLIDDPNREEIVALLRDEMQRWFHRYAGPYFDGVREPVTGNGQNPRFVTTDMDASSS